MAKDSLDLVRTRAKEALSRGEYQAARQIYERALIFRDDSLEIHYGLATVCFLLNDLDKAAHHFKEVLRIDPLRANAHINLGAVYDRLGKYEESLEALNNGILLDPDRAEGHYNIALVYKHFGDMDKAIAAYREAIRLSPRMYEAHYNLGNILFEKNQYDQAVVHYRDALELRPNCDKTQKALESAQFELSQSGERQLMAPSPGGGKPESLALTTAELDRALDPKRHHKWLSALHHLSVDINNGSSALLDFLKNQVEEAIRDLSICIVASKDARFSLDDQLVKFDEVVVKLLRLHQSLERRIARAKTLSHEMVMIKA